MDYWLHDQGYRFCDYIQGLTRTERWRLWAGHLITNRLEEAARDEQSGDANGRQTSEDGLSEGDRKMMNALSEQSEDDPGVNPDVGVDEGMQQ